MKIFYEKPTRWLRDKGLVKVEWCCSTAESSFTIKGDLVYLNAGSFEKWNIKYCPFCGQKIEINGASRVMIEQRKKALEEAQKVIAEGKEIKRKWGAT